MVRNQDDGALFMWGCVFATENGCRTLDHHRGCLGTGDRFGRLLPTKYVALFPTADRRGNATEALLLRVENPR